MILKIKLHRPEIVPWGFRLTGGAEFEAPLTVTKVISICSVVGFHTKKALFYLNRMKTLAAFRFFENLIISIQWIQNKPVLKRDSFEIPCCFFNLYNKHTSNNKLHSINRDL